MSKELNPEKALIFRIIHRDNMPWILDNGLQCANSIVIDPNYISIGNPELIDKRKTRKVPCPPGGTLSDYIPFYFTPWSVMLFNIKTGWGGIRKRMNDEIVILVSSLPLLKKQGLQFLFTDRHAYLEAAQFFSDLDLLDQINWNALQNRMFKRNADDPSKFEQYQAEALVHRRMDTQSLLGAVCYTEAVASDLRRMVERRNLPLQVLRKSGWYF